MSLTGGNRNDVTQLMPLIEALPPVRGRRGRPRRRPDTLFADRAYDHDKYREQVQAAGITPIIARRGTAQGSVLGKDRWVVEQVRREALIDRVEVRDLRLRPVAAGR